MTMQAGIEYGPPSQRRPRLRCGLGGRVLGRGGGACAAWMSSIQPPILRLQRRERRPARVASAASSAAAPRPAARTDGDLGAGGGDRALWAACARGASATARAGRRPRRRSSLDPGGELVVGVLDPAQVAAAGGEVVVAVGVEEQLRSRRACRLVDRDEARRRARGARARRRRRRARAARARRRPRRGARPRAPRPRRAGRPAAASRAAATARLPLGGGELGLPRVDLAASARASLWRRAIRP